MHELTPAFVDNYRIFKADSDNAEQVILERLGDILTIYHEVYGIAEFRKNLSWYFGRPDEGEVGNFEVDNLTGDLTLEYGHKHPKFEHQEIENHFYDTIREIPTDWLYKTNEELRFIISDELEICKKEYLEEIALKQITKEAKKKLSEEMKAKKEEILAKLTKEERKALGLK